MAHRKSIYPKLSAIAKQLGTDFYLVEGDMVSYRGEKWLLLEVTGPPNQPMTAKIQQATHADAVANKVVKCDTLRPLASMREKLLYTADVPATVGDFVFFSQDKKIDGEQRSLVLSGKVTHVDGTEMCTTPAPSISATSLRGNAKENQTPARRRSRKATDRS